MKLYRYLSYVPGKKTESAFVRKLLRSLEEPHIVLSNPELFNDPFEFKFSILRRDDEPRNTRWATEVTGRSYCLHSTKVISFSKFPDNLLMWAVYGRAHTGVVLEFSDAFVDWLKRHSAMFSRVRYGKDVPLLDIRQGEDPNVAAKLFFAKSTAWRHEKEYRAIFLDSTEDKLTMPKDMLSGVILGARCSQRLENALYERLGEGNYPRLKEAIIMHRQYRIVIQDYTSKVRPMRT